MEGTAIFILAIIFGTIFGIFYLFFSTRNKERLALIEKGMEAKIFSPQNPLGIQLLQLDIPRLEGLEMSKPRYRGIQVSLHGVNNVTLKCSTNR